MPVMYGWRWYRIEGGRLVSPIVGATRYGSPITLPRSGLLHDVFFLPSAADMYGLLTNTILRYESGLAEHLTVTYGRVSGPLEPDPDMGHVRSMRCGRYDALAILTNSRSPLERFYDAPVMRPLRAASMLAVERHYGPPRGDRAPTRGARRWVLV